jgi:hypothetical protein
MLISVNNFDGARRFLFTSGERVRKVRLDGRDVENRVNAREGFGETDFVGPAGDLLLDFVGTEVSLGEFLRRSGGCNELGGDKDLVSDLENGVGRTFLVSDLFVTLRSNSNLRTEIFVNGLEIVDVILSKFSVFARNGGLVESNSRMITLVREERCESGGSVWNVVERKLSKGEELCPVVLLVGAVHPDVLFEGLIHAFRLSVSFRVMTGSKMHLHVEQFAQCAEERGDEFRASVTSDVGRDSVFREDVNKEDPGELGRVDVSVTGDENNLLGSTINDDADAIILAGIWKEFNEVDRNGMPRAERNRKRSEEAIGLVPWGLVALAMSAGSTIIPNKRPHFRPGVFSTDESQSTVLSKMAGEYVVMLML